MAAECAVHGAYTGRGYRFSAGGRGVSSRGEGGLEESGDRHERVVWGGCPMCLAQGDAARQARAEAVRLARERDVLEERLERSCLPKRFVGKTFESFLCSYPTQERVLHLAMGYVRDFGWNASRGLGLIFLGGVGTGKSHLAAAILQAVMRTHQGLYVTVADVVRMVRGTWRRDSGCSEAQMIGKLVGVDLLVIDEVGKQYGTEGEEHILFDVLDGRYREMRPTILLGNVTAAELPLYVGERAADRLRETNTAVVFDWGSYRRG